MKHYIGIFFGTLMLISISACSESSDSPEGESIDYGVAEKISLTTEETNASVANNAFGIKFLASELAKHQENENIIVSPFSATMVLSMFANCCDTELLTQITDLFETNDIESLNSYTSKVASELSTIDPTTSLSIANSVWYEQNYTLNPDFKAAAATYYNASCYPSDFIGNPKGVEDEVNYWISENTNGMIKGMNLDFNSATMMSLANALYFKGIWKQPFKKANTRDEEFNGSEHTSIVSMMNTEDYFQYSASDNYKAVGMVFGNNAFEAFFILPTEGCTPLNTLNRLDITALNYSKRAKITLSLPRFKLTNLDQIDLTGTLVGMGLTSLSKPNNIKAFTEDIDVKVNVLQKASFEVDEEGAKAAAATALNLDYSPGLIEDHTVTFDRPFLFFIIEKSTSTILFAGRIAQL